MFIDDEEWLSKLKRAEDEIENYFYIFYEFIDFVGGGKNVLQCFRT